MFSTKELQYLKALKSKHYLRLSDAMEDKVRRSIISKLNRWTNTEEPVISRLLTLSDSTWKFNEDGPRMHEGNMRNDVGHIPKWMKEK